jgi:hypothetical protein
MLEPSVSRLDRLKGMRTLFRFLLVAPTRQSLRLFALIIKELDNMILEWETELQLRSLVLARQAPAVHPPFDDGDHLVEDQIPNEHRDPSAASTQ